MNAIARQSTVIDLIEEYDQKRAAIDAEVRSFEAAYTRLEAAPATFGPPS
ncbi:hypothetical protein NKH10_19400 [Mesorhizobium sp. M1340]